MLFCDAPSENQAEGVLVGLLVFSRVLLGLRLRANAYGGDVAFILFSWALGYAWGR